jgi:DNA-binding XRE family transcriptional regulator
MRESFSLFLRVTERLLAMAQTRTETPRKRLGRYLAQARIARGLKKGAAARAAGMTQTTWMHIENGTAETHDLNLAAAERVVGWAPGSAAAVQIGGEPILLPYAGTTAEPGQVVPNEPELTSRSRSGSHWRPGAEDEIRQVLSDAMVHAIPAATGANIQAATAAAVEALRKRGLITDGDADDD